MESERGKTKRTGPAPNSAGGSGAALGGLPDLARKALSIGLSGFFLTEETIRKALGDTLPKEWMDFAADQSERTRKEFLERLSYEIAQSFERIDLAAVLREILEGRTLHVSARIRLQERDEDADGPHLHVSIEPNREES